jgi:arginyl-tRNA synthetase
MVQVQMMVQVALARSLREKVTESLSEQGLDIPVEFTVLVEQPTRLEHGDFATNVAMKLAKVLRKSPMDIAMTLKPQIEALPLVSRIEVVAPGFMNIFLDWNHWAQIKDTVPENHFRKHTKVLVEHTSINPNKAAHIGHLRNACIGDTLARLMKRIGYNVEVCNYIDDLGNQVADTVVGLLYAPHEGNYERFSDYCWDLYSKVNKIYDTDEDFKGRRTEVLHALEEGTSNIAWVGALVAEKIVRDHLEDMQAFGISYDILVWEGDIARQGFWHAAFELLKTSPLFQLEAEGKFAGCWVLKQPNHEAVDDEHHADKVLVRSNGILTYTAKDIAYHLWKFNRLGKDFKYRKFAEGLWISSSYGDDKPFGRAEKVYNVIDQRQEYPQLMVKLALETLGYTDAAENLHHVGYGVVNLSPATARRLGIDTSDGKASYAMSGRKGIGVKITDFLALMEETIENVRPRKEGISSREIAAAVIRYYMLRFNLVTEIVFDLDLAADIHGNSGVYVMYQHARAKKILRDGGWGHASATLPLIPNEISDSERALLRHISIWNDVLEQAAETVNLTMLTTYTYELASLFSSFYDANPVLKEKGELRLFRLWLVHLFAETLADALNVLGLPAPERM